jgi:Flp pilus assembly pilin Flp
MQHLSARVLLAAADAADTIRSRLPDDDERGAQVAEYAMLAGVSAAACGALVALLRNGEFLQGVVSAVVTAFTRALRSWF